MRPSIAPAIGAALAGTAILTGWSPSATLDLLPDWVVAVIGASAMIGGLTTAASWLPRISWSRSWALRQAGAPLATPGLGGYALAVLTHPELVSVVPAILALTLLAGLWAGCREARHEETQVRGALDDAA